MRTSRRSGLPLVRRRSCQGMVGLGDLEFGRLWGFRILRAVPSSRACIFRRNGAVDLGEVVASWEKRLCLGTQGTRGRCFRVQYDRSRLTLAGCVGGHGDNSTSGDNREHVPNIATTRGRERNKIQ